LLLSISIYKVISILWEQDMRAFLSLMVILYALLLSGCGYNTLQATDEQIKASWAEVLNQYKRRADLVPNLVNTVKGFAAQEKDVLLGVTTARSRVGSIQATPELLNNPEAFAKSRTHKANYRVHSFDYWSSLRTIPN
jgi:hypothetical protein